RGAPRRPAGEAARGGRALRDRLVDRRLRAARRLPRARPLAGRRLSPGRGGRRLPRLPAAGRPGRRPGGGDAVADAPGGDLAGHRGVRRPRDPRVLAGTVPDPPPAVPGRDRAVPAPGRGRARPGLWVRPLLAVLRPAPARRAL